jgi:NDP-sugar pyrophosphorylase family protein
LNSGALLTISSYKRIQDIDYGVLEVNENRFLSGFKEKPKIPFEVSMGIYILNKKALELIPENKYYGFDHLVLDLLRADEKINVVLHEGYWLDIGKHDDFEKAQLDIKNLLL